MNNLCFTYMKLTHWGAMWIKTALYFFASPQRIKRLKLYFKYGSREIFLEDIYRGVHRHKVYHDVGAYVGDSTAYFALMHPRSKVIAYEPTKLYKKIPKLKNIEVRNVAVGEEGYVDLVGGDLTTRTVKGTQTKSVKLSKHINEPCFVKLDCEGAEYAIWRDLFASKKIKHVKEFVCEFHVTDTDSQFGKAIAQIEKEYALHYRSDMCPLARKHTQQDILVHGIRKE